MQRVRERRWGVDWYLQCTLYGTEVNNGTYVSVTVSKDMLSLKCAQNQQLYLRDWERSRLPLYLSVLFFSFKFYVTGLLLNLNLIFKKLSFQTDSGPTKLPEVRSDRSPHSFPTDDFPRCFFLDPNLGLPKTKINFIFISASGIYATSLSLCPEKNIGISRLICSSWGGDSQREAC